MAASTVLDRSFNAMGTTARIVADPGADLDAERVLAQIEAHLSRFDADSELARLNADRRAAVPAGPLLRAAVRAALRAAALSGGLVDPTLAPELERAGYAGSRAELEPAPLAEALAAAPSRRPARPAHAARWRLVEVDDAAGLVRRPPGLELDLGGSAKGWAADRIAESLGEARRFAVDCGGDLRVDDRTGGAWAVQVRHPLRDEPARTLRVRAGGVATSGIDARLWRLPDGSYAHHLLDPASGAPAWTGLIAATALAATALAAEALAKAALLSGPEGARRLLAPRGGVLVHDDGRAEALGPLAVAG